MRRPPVLTRDVMRVLDHWDPQGWSDSDLCALKVGAGNGTRLGCESGTAEPIFRSEAVADNGQVDSVGISNLGHHRCHRGTGSAECGILGDVGQRPTVTDLARKRSGSLASRGAGCQPGRLAAAPRRRWDGTTVAAPYDSIDETAFVRAAKLAGRVNRAGRLWVVGGSFGGGLHGSELALATVDDFEEIAGGRLVVRTKGLSARLVPILRAHTEVVREALDHACNGRFIKATGRNRAYRIGSALDSGDGKGLSLRPGPVPPGCKPTWSLGHHWPRCGGWPDQYRPTPWRRFSPKPPTFSITKPRSWKASEHEHARRTPQAATGRQNGTALH